MNTHAHTHTCIRIYVHLHWPTVMYEMLETLHVTLIRVEIQELHAVRYTTDIHKLQDARLRILAISTATSSRPI